MNDMSVVNSIKTMTSREIAALTGKQHDNVLRDIRKMLFELHGEGGVLKFEGGYLDANGQERPMFTLPRHETMVLVTGYSVSLRSKVIARWEELEARPAVAQSAAQAVQDDTAAMILRVYRAMAEFPGVKPNMAMTTAPSMIERETGRSMEPMRLMLPAGPVRLCSLNATRLAGAMGMPETKTSAATVNRRLMAEGMQTRNERGDWQLTAEGAKWGEHLPYSQACSGYQILWNPALAEHLNDLDDGLPQ